MKSIEYGNKDGQLVIYFHGAPGAIEECAVFDDHAKAHNLRIICFDRFAIDHSLDRDSYYQYISDQIKSIAGSKPVDIIGFSIGAHVALEVGALLDNQLRHSHLISAAAPINAGDFIDHMAGGLVFKLAMQRPLIFSLLTGYQKIMAILAPRLLASMLFTSAAGKDKELKALPNFKKYITPLLKHCFVHRAKGYIRDIKFYVSWPGKLSGYTGSVQLWHGSLDNWSPLSMASYLSNALPGAGAVEAMAGLSHYSCLYAAAPKICAQLEIP